MRISHARWVDEQKNKNANEHNDLKILLKTSGIACKKYNYSFDTKPQPNYSALIRLSQDDKELVVTHQTLTLAPAGPDFSKVPPVNADTGYFEALEIEKMKQDILSNTETFVQERKSHASCLVKDIKGFVYGGFNSRFWIARKHVILKSRKELDHLPFYNWECISLELNHRSIDLVIQNQASMDKFIKFLIYTLKTVDGVAGSSEPILKEKFQTEC